MSRMIPRRVVLAAAWAAMLVATVAATARADMEKDSPVTFPERGALPAKYPPDRPSRQRESPEEGYSIFGMPERSVEQIDKIQAEMPAGRFTAPRADWTHLRRTREVLNRGGKLHVMAIGDSIVNDTMRSGWLAKLSEAYPKAEITGTVYVRGGGGCQHYKAEDRIERFVVPRKPDLVFLGGISQQDIESIRDVIHQLRKSLPEVEILLASGTFGTADPRVEEELARARHSGTGEYGRQLAALAADERCAYLDMTTPWAEYIRSSGEHPHRFYRDRVHANEYGEQILAKILMAYFDQAREGSAVEGASGCESPGAAPSSATEQPEPAAQTASSTAKGDSSTTKAAPPSAVVASMSVQVDAVSSAAAPTPSAERPNIVLILADDWGYADASCYGGKIPTPHVDRLAAAGMRFTDAHSPSSVCTPTRYGLLTGRYCWRTKLQRHVLGGLSPRLIESGRMTIASMLKQHGYYTACVGKWHLGMNWALKPGGSVAALNIEPRKQVFNVDYDQPIAEGPNSVGFDEYFGISGSLDMVPYTFIENDHVTASPTEDRDFPMMQGRATGRTRKGPTAPGFEAAQVLPTLTRRACEVIERRAADAKAGKPFFLYLPFASPHTPILPTAEWQGKSEINPYADFVMQTDAAVGQVLETLERHGLAETTLVVFTSDNGCSPQADFDALAAKGHRPSGPLRGAKADIFEGGHRVPLVARWPGRVPPGKTCDRLVCLTDVMATLAELLGVAIPPGAGEDSFSFLPALRGGDASASATPARDHLVSHSINGTFAIRQGPWKLILAPDSGGWSAPRPGSPLAASLPPAQLYDLSRDLAEQHNLQQQQPDKVRQLRELLERIVAEGRSTPGPKQPNSAPVELPTASSTAP